MECDLLGSGFRSGQLISSTGETSSLFRFPNISSNSAVQRQLEHSGGLLLKRPETTTNPGQGRAGH